MGEACTVCRAPGCRDPECRAALLDSAVPYAFEARPPARWAGQSPTISQRQRARWEKLCRAFALIRAGVAAGEAAVAAGLSAVIVYRHAQAHQIPLRRGPKAGSEAAKRCGDRRPQRSGAQRGAAGRSGAQRGAAGLGQMNRVFLEELRRAATEE